MRKLATWLVLAGVGAVVLAGVVDSVRRPTSQTESANGGPTSGRSTTTGPASQSTTTGPASQSTTANVASAETVGTTAPAVQSTAPEQLSACTTGQLELAFTLWLEGLAAAVLRRVAGNPCHHGRSRVRFAVHDQWGDRVTVFGPPRGGFTSPADFSHGFEQLIEFPLMSCDPAGSFLVVARVGPYVARERFPGRNLVCSHD